MGSPASPKIQTPPTSSAPAPIAAKVPEKAPLLKTSQPIAAARNLKIKQSKLKKVEIKPQASGKKAQATKFEVVFLKLDDEDDDDNPKKKLTLDELKLEKETSKMSETVK
jgi:hypothetical protein